MNRNSYTREDLEGETIPVGIDLLLAQHTENAKTVNFAIPALRGSLETELHSLRDLLLCFHKHQIPARAVMPVLKSGYGPDAAVSASGLALWASIQDLTPEGIVWVRIMCRKLIRQMAWSKGLHIGRGHWTVSMEEMVGELGRGRLASQVRTFTKNIRESFLTGKTLTNGITHYRVSRDGVLESAEVDFRQESTRLKFSKVAIPEKETVQPKQHVASHGRPAKGRSRGSLKGKPRRWGDLARLCR